MQISSSSPHLQVSPDNPNFFFLHLLLSVDGDTSLGTVQVVASGVPPPPSGSPCRLPRKAGASETLGGWQPV